MGKSHWGSRADTSCPCIQFYFGSRNNSGPYWRGLCRWESLVSIQVRRWTEKVKAEVSSPTLEQGPRNHSERDKDQEDGRAWTQEGGIQLRREQRDSGQLQYGFSLGTGGMMGKREGIRSLGSWAQTGPALWACTRGPRTGHCLVYCSAVTVLKAPIILEQEAPPFHLCTEPHEFRS